MANAGEKYKVNNVLASHVLALNYITPDSVVLDVGCACGDFGVLLKKEKNSTIFGLEYDKDSCKIATDTGVYQEVIQFDLETLTNDSFQNYNNKFDYIVCNDILEHLRDPEKTIKILKKFLKTSGVIIASIPNIAHASIKSNLLLNDFTYTPYGLLDETHVHFFTYKSIANMFASAGFSIERSCFSSFEKTGLQPNNPYEYLSDDIKRFILENWHSYVWQYVIKCVPSDEEKSKLYTKNIAVVDINDKNAPDYVKQYRQQQLADLTDKNIQLQELLNRVVVLNNKVEENKKKAIKYFYTILLSVICLLFINIIPFL